MYTYGKIGQFPVLIHATVAVPILANTVPSVFVWRVQDLRADRSRSSHMQWPLYAHPPSTPDVYVLSQTFANFRKNPYCCQDDITETREYA